MWKGIYEQAGATAVCSCVSVGRIREDGNSVMMVSSRRGLSFPCGEELLDYGAPDGARHYSHGRDNLCWTGNTEQWYLTRTSLLLFLRFLEGECPEFAIAVMLLVWIVFTH